MSATFYNLLEVSRSASQEEIVAAYRRLHSRLAARINGVAGADEGTLERIEALREAFATLSDPKRRQQYDVKLLAPASPVSAIIEKAPRTFLRPMLTLGLATAVGLAAAKVYPEYERARLERERIAAEAKVADLLLQREREAQKAAAQADLDRRRREAMERFHRELGQKGQPPAMPAEKTQS